MEACKSVEEIAKGILEELIEYDQWRDNLHINDFATTRRNIIKALSSERKQAEELRKELLAEQQYSFLQFDELNATKASLSKCKEALKNNQILIVAERIKHKRYCNHLNYMKKVLGKARLSRKIYGLKGDGKICREYYSCCSAQGSCELKSFHRGPHIGNIMGIKSVWLTERDGLSDSVKTALNQKEK